MAGVALVAASLVVPAPTPALAPAPAAAQAAGPITVTAVPSTGLVDFQFVHVTGTGFEPFELREIFQCRADAVDESGCDPDNADFVSADADGVVEVDWPVDARIYDMTGREFDCRSVPNGCKIGIGLLAEFENSGFALLDFDPDAPLLPVVTVAVTPDEDLTDGQTVTVHGTGLLDRFETFAYQCAAGAPRSAATCNFDQDVRGIAEPDGTIALEYRVDAQLRPANGDPPIDCTAAPGACVIELALGFSNRPDRFARTPISFRTAGPGPTTTTTTPGGPTTTGPTATTTAPSTPPPPPARPVVHAPTFTG
ncbi:MAG TPA: neocarzinostatin apoprotein domain-containing protein [Acidimicrobiales bacterium]